VHGRDGSARSVDGFEHPIFGQAGPPSFHGSIPRAATYHLTADAKTRPQAVAAGALAFLASVPAGQIDRQATEELTMIEARGLTKRYGDTLAVDDLSFEVRPGRVTGFLGPNGAGKSTTMRMILGLDDPTSGSVTIDGHRYAEHERPLGQIGALLDAKAVHPGRSAYHHLLALAQTNGIPPRRVPEVLELVGLEQVARQRAGRFSLGMGQRLGIAAALLGDPAVLLFDEPVNGLDPEGIRWIRELLKSLAAEGRTVFVSSHLMSEMALMAEHLVVIGRGRLIADASVDELVGGSSLNTVRVRTPHAEQFTWTLAANGARVDRAPDGTLTVSGLDPVRIGDLAATDRITLHELSLKRASLEEAFMELTEDSVEFRASMLDTPMITANGATS
jgi:ABC-2 type transport system ATP-binding protein